jgi:hypothetical protein
MEQRYFRKLSCEIAIDVINRTAREMTESGCVKRDLSDKLDKYGNLRLEKATGFAKAQLSVF